MDQHVARIEAALSEEAGYLFDLDVADAVKDVQAA